MVRAESHLRPSGSTRFRWRPGCLVAALVLLSSAPLRAETSFEATYAVSFAGVEIGRAEARSRFSGSAYAAVVKGATSGISRLVSDARATLTGSGRYAGGRIAPTSYTIETAEGEFETHVRMSIGSNRITDLLAIPRLLPAPDRIPVEERHRRGIVDPLAAFLVATGGPGLPAGDLACRRTIAVFDGWQRFDIKLAYKETRETAGAGEAYRGKVVVCAARYVPIAGHRTGREAVADLAANKRLEIWYAPLGNLPLLAPYRILVGTKYGDLVINSTRFVTREAGSSIGN